jgi:hypothetical protein
MHARALCAFFGQAGAQGEGPEARAYVDLRGRGLFVREGLSTTRLPGTKGQ